MPQVHNLNFSLALVILMAGGCNTGNDSAFTMLDIDSRVRLISAGQDFALIETADSQRYYVNRAILKTRSNLIDAQDPSHTHTLSAPTRAFQGDLPESIPETPPRSLDEISKEQMMLNRLYLTEKTHRRIIAPSNTRPFVDKLTGENVWPACTCHNPNCPKKSINKEPYLFVLFDRNSPPICPACVEGFGLHDAEQEELAPYLRWTKTYELEEKKQRVKQLDAERKRAYRALKESTQNQ